MASKNAKGLSAASSGAVGPPKAAPGGSRGDKEPKQGYNSNYQPEQIIHRSSNCIIVAGSNKPKEFDPQAELRGYKAPQNSVYVPLGKPDNVLPVIDGLKSLIEHSQEQSAETLKMIQKVKRNGNPMFTSGQQPERTLRIMYQGRGPGQMSSHPAKGVSQIQKQAGRKKGAQKIDFAEEIIPVTVEGDPTTIMIRMKMIEEQFMANPILHDAAFNRKNKDTNQAAEGAEDKEGNEDAERGEDEHFTNQRLMTPRMKKLMNNKDAREVLQEEINESSLRLKQAKFGHKLVDIIPDHGNSFYLPDKSRYLPKEKETSAIGNSSSSQILKPRAITNMARTVQKQIGHSPMLPRGMRDNRASSSINEAPSMFMTEPPSAFKAAANLQQPSIMNRGGQGGYPVKNFNSGMGMSHMMRGSNFGASTQAESNTAHNSQFTQMMNRQNMKNMQGRGHLNMNINMNSRLSEYSHNIGGGGNLPQPNSGLYVYRQGSTLTQVGNQMIGGANNSFYGNNSTMLSNNTRRMGNSLGPSMNRGQHALQSQSVAGYQAQGRQRNTSFKEVWRKAIEKYSPKKSMKLNEVSYRFQLKLEEHQAATNKGAIDTGPADVSKGGKIAASFRGDDEDQIKFVSMIDQKPIQPSYLELITLKNFPKKEQEAQRQQFKDSQKQESNDNKQMGMSSINWSKMLHKELDDEFKKRKQQMDKLKLKKAEEYKVAIKLKIKEVEKENGCPCDEDEILEIEQNEYDELYTQEDQAVIRYRRDLAAKHKLTSNQELLLAKVIDFSSLWEYDSKEIRHCLYKLFFNTNQRELQGYLDDLGKKHDLERKKNEKKDGKEDKDKQKGEGEEGDEKKDNNKDKENIAKKEEAKKRKEQAKEAEQKHEEENDIKDDASQNNAQADTEQDKEDKKMRQQIRLEQELFDFEDQGGFPKVLREIFNPTDQASMELDSVYQLKQLCKAFYEKKENLSKSLVQCLDALANERPWTVKMKKKHFDTSSNNLITDVEYMRINAERERIKKYQEITKGSAYTYYKILKRLSKDSVKMTKENSSNTRETQDPQIKIKLAIQETKVKNLLNYMTDFIKQVVENGNEFEKSHYFMLLMNLRPEEICEPMIINALKIFAEELEITEFEYVEFNQSLSRDPALEKAYFDIRKQIFSDDA